MAKKLNIACGDILPSAEQILAGQSVPPERLKDQRCADLTNGALEAFERLGQPVGLMAETTKEEFGLIYTGEGMNASETVLDNILPASKHLCLFAVTVGETICREIAALFERQDFAAAAMLDAAASAGAELAVELITKEYQSELSANNQLNSSEAVLPFSPGYCGWHVSGQKKLFARLQPETIGIQLSDSCLMQPLKSVSGVLVAAAIADFEVTDSFSFCDQCTNRSCQERHRQLLGTR